MVIESHKHPPVRSLFFCLAFIGAVAHASRGYAQSGDFTIRPTVETDVVLVGNPQHARDADEYSAAGGSWGRVCHTNCEEPIVATGTWSRMPGGYRPLHFR